MDLNNKIFLNNKIPYQAILIAILPLAFVAGNAAINFIITLYSLFLIFNLKEVFFFLKKNLKLLSIVFLIIFIYQVFSSLLSKYPFYSLLTSLTFFKYFVIFVFINFYLNKINNSYLKTILKIWTIIYILILIDCIFQLYFGKNLIGYKSLTTFSQFSNCTVLTTNILNECSYFFNTVRLGSFFKDELIVGSYLASFFFYITYFNKKFFFFYFVLFISVFVIYFSGERMSFIGIVFILLLTFILNKNFKIFILIAIFIFSSFIVGYNFSKTIKNRYDEIIYLVKQNKNNDLPYFSLWKNGIYLYKNNNNFLTGIGPKNYRRYCKDIAFLKSFNKYNNSTVDSKIIINSGEFISGKNECSTHVHNYYLEILIETGILGFGLYLFFFFLIIKDSYKKITYKKNIFILFNFSSLIFILLPLKTTGSFFSTYYGILFWTILSLNYFFINYYNEK